MDYAKQQWFLRILKGMVKKPKAVNFGIRSGRFDLEIIILATEEDKRVFTEEVCIALSVILSSATGAIKPIVYLDESPHPSAAESIRYADSQC